MLPKPLASWGILRNQSKIIKTQNGLVSFIKKLHFCGTWTLVAEFYWLLSFWDFWVHKIFTLDSIILFGVSHDAGALCGILRGGVWALLLPWKFQGAEFVGASSGMFTSQVWILKIYQKFLTYCVRGSEIPFPTTWNLSNLVNNGISTTNLPQLVSWSRISNEASIVAFHENKWIWRWATCHFQKMGVDRSNCQVEFVFFFWFPKNQRLDPPKKIGLNLFFASGLFGSPNQKTNQYWNFCDVSNIFWNPKNFLKKIKQIFFFQPSEPVTTWDPNDCRSWSVGVEQCLCLSCVWVISLGQLFRRPAWLAPNFLVN